MAGTFNAVVAARENTISGVAAFQHRLGQLLDKQRHSIRPFDDLGDNIARQHFVAGDALDQRGAFATGEPIENKRRDVCLSRPRRTETPGGK